jgi:hypothetical protein
LVLFFKKEHFFFFTLSRCGVMMLAAVLLVGGPARADNAAIPFARLAGFRRSFNAVPASQRDKLIFVLSIGHADKLNHLPIRAWVNDAGKRVDIAVAADGVVTLPERPDWDRSGVMVQTDQPKGTLNIEIDLAVKVPAGQTIAVSYLLDAVRQGNDAMRAGARQLGGYMAMLMAPVSKEVDITLTGCCGGTATVEGVVLRQAASGIVAIPLGVLQDHAQGALALSAPATAIDLFPN